MILLGWKIGSGERVEIPDTGHLAWFGQTQLSGKTTALEGIAFRGELKAVAFITKQGEGGFLTGRMIPPYFSEPTNDEEQPLWRWVKSILEASQQRKLTFEEAWIIRCCEDPRSARTLKDVHENIKALLGGEGGYVEKGRGKKKKREWKYTRKPVSGINAGVYTSLKAYFDIVMPQLARLPYTKKLALGPGLNVMDLREYAMETQALVIRSVMEWVYQHEKNVRVIVPEAQDFVPQGKNSPVKMACETLVRKAGANRNFMWLDSQDMAAVDKIMLRACSIVGIGVQTEGHEIDRSLASLFTPALKAVDIARLRIGEFFVRTPEAKVAKVYVQPAWMESELHAQAIARGEESVSSARQMLRAFKDSRKTDSRKDSQKPQLLQLQIQEQPDGDNERDSCSDADGDLPAQGMYFDRDGFQPRTDQLSRDPLFDPDRFQPQGNADVHLPTVQHLYAKQEEIPSPQILNETEPGKHEIKKAESPGDPGIAGNVERTESAIQDSPVHAALPGAPVCPGNGGQDRTESEGTMPQAKTPLEAIENFLAGGESSFDRNRRVDFLTILHAFIIEHRALIAAHDALAARVQQEENRPLMDWQPVPPEPGSILNNRTAQNGGLSLDAIYKYVRERAAKDPGILELLVRRPELRVKVERTVIHAHGDKLDGQLATLLSEGFFDKPRDRGAIGNELRRRAWMTSTANLKILSPYLSKLAAQGFLTIEPSGYQAVPEMKVMVQKA
jgi:hypothetical protein